MSELIECPFCHMSDFDLIGLKIHFFYGHCEVYNETPLDDEMAEEEIKERDRQSENHLKHEGF